MVENHCSRVLGARQFWNIHKGWYLKQVTKTVEFCRRGIDIIFRRYSSLPQLFFSRSSKWTHKTLETKYELCTKVEIQHFQTHRLLFFPKPLRQSHQNARFLAGPYNCNSSGHFVDGRLTRSMKKRSSSKFQFFQNWIQNEFWSPSLLFKLFVEFGFGLKDNGLFYCCNYEPCMVLPPCWPDDKKTI